MNPLALAALASIFVASHAKQDRPIWQNESRLQEYQIAWTSLNKSKEVTYYQVRGTELLSAIIYNNKAERMETNYTCWSVQMLSLSQSEQNGVRRYNFKVTATDSVHFVDEPVAAVSALNYTTIKNGVHYEYRKDYKNHTDPVIFTDGEMCDLLNVPRVSPQDGCELWVRSDYKDNVPPCCSFIYDLLCDVEKSYEIYDQNECRKVVQSLETETR
uniref:Lipocalin n=1 Tax=Rhipicephalus zambeziensis TaxID=60191 RepID=A0A224YBG9_9ACAR